MGKEQLDHSNRFEIDNLQFTEEENPDGLGDSIVLRIARRPLHEQARGKLLELFGKSTRIITCTSAIFGQDPAGTLHEIIEALENEGYDVMAVDLVASWDVKHAIATSQKIIQPILVQELARDYDNEVITLGRDETGRDILEVLEYRELKANNSH